MISYCNYLYLKLKKNIIAPTYKNAHFFCMGCHCCKVKNVNAPNKLKSGNEKDFNTNVVILGPEKSGKTCLWLNSVETNLNNNEIFSVIETSKIFIPARMRDNKSICIWDSLNYYNLQRISIISFLAGDLLLRIIYVVNYDISTDKANIIFLQLYELLCIINNTFAKLFLLINVTSDCFNEDESIKNSVDIKIKNLIMGLNIAVLASTFQSYFSYDVYNATKGIKNTMLE